MTVAQLAPPTLPGYTITGRAYSGPRVVLYRARRDADAAAVLLKTPQDARPSARDTADLEHEYEVLNRLVGAPVVAALAFVHHESRPWLVLEDVGGEALDQISARYREPTEAVAIGIKIAEALSEVHRRGVVHRDVKPHHVIVLDDGSIRLTGFRVASLLRIDASVASVQGTLAFMAPEQTGRMNRPVDKRADLYALGVTLYALVTGRLPFQATDPLELIHAHIAIAPAPPDEVADGIPAALSAIVLKLLSKHAEDRYHGAAGVARDLERCAAALAQGGPAEFTLGEDDAPDEFRVSHRLYGRDAEVAALIDGFERARTGPTAVVSLVGGYSGVGKTAVVGELYQPIVRERGRFVSGKFDQYKRDIPYATIVQAFRDLVRDLLASGESALEDWRRRLSLALGSNGQVVVDVVPELEHVIGPQPALAELEPVEAQNRFESTFLALVRVFARRDHPLVVFLDDLQWADAATLGVLKLLARPGEVPALQLVLAYRDNEVDAAHPFRRCVDAMSADGAAVHDVHVTDLAPEFVTRLVADTVSRSPDEPAVRSLVRLVIEKAGGNPFFINELLHALDARGLFEFDFLRRGWIWDEASIQAVDVADNVVDLLIGRLRKLPALAQVALEHASCFGNRFTLRMLAAALELPATRVADSLFAALNEGLISDVGTELGDQRRYRFQHDRIQQAAYSLLSDAERGEVHLRIGRRLREALEAGDEDLLFDVVKHLDHAAHLIDDPAERQQVVELNLAASRRAKAAIAWEPARLYLESAVALFGDDAWSAHYDTTFEVLRDLAQCEFLTGRFAAAEQRFDALREAAESAARRAEVATLQVRLFVLTGRYDQALRLGMDELERLGEPFPARDEDIPSAIEVEEQRLGHRLDDANAILDLPRVSDDEKRAAIELLASLPPAIYSRQPAVFPILATKPVNLSLTYGNCEASCFGYSMYAMLLAAARDDPARGFAVSEASIALNERLRDPKLLGTVLHVHANHLMYWVRPYADAISMLERAYDANLEVGDLTIAAYTIFMGAWMDLERGRTVSATDAALDEYEKLMQATRHSTAQDIVRVQRNFNRALSGHTLASTSLSSDDFDADAARERIAAAGLETALAMHDLLKAMLAWHHARFDRARHWLSRAAQSLPAAFCLPLEMTWQFFDALTIAAGWEVASAEDRPAQLARIAEIEKRFAGWASNCEPNFGARHAILAGELARLEQRPLDAQREYQRGARAAQRNGDLASEAIATLLAARFHERYELEMSAEAWRREHKQVLRQWGATLLLSAYESAHPELLEEAETEDASDVMVRAESSRFDTLAALKLSQALSREVDVDGLTETLLRIVLENSGAQRAAVLLKRGNQLGLESVAEAGAPLGRGSGPAASADGKRLPQSVLRYVERTRSTLVLHNALDDSTFRADPYIVDKQIRSVMCMPIVIRAQLAGVLYLENALVAGAFFAERLALLEVMAAQLAISLENAQLYQEREERAAEAARQEALQLGDRRYREIVESMGDAFLALDPRWCVVAANRNFVNLARATRLDDLLGRNIWELFPEAADTQYMTEYRAAMEQRLERHFIEHYAPYDIWTEVDVFPSTDGGIAVFIRDVSERVRAERKRDEMLEAETAAREAAERTLRYNEMFAGMLGHDLRNPLSAIVSGASYLARGGVEPGKVVAIAKRIRSSSDRMTRMIDQLLDFTRIRVGDGIPVAFDTLDVAACCRHVGEESEAAHLDRSVEIEACGDAVLDADADRLQQVMSNLIGNALQHGGSAPVRVRVDGRALDAVTVSVWNAGAMPAELLPTVFEPFRSGRGRSSGLGLGLYITREIVKAHGGTIAVTSSTEDGTTFTVRLPRRARTAQRTAVAAESSSTVEASRDSDG